MKIRPEPFGFGPFFMSGYSAILPRFMTDLLAVTSCSLEGISPFSSSACLIAISIAATAAQLAVACPRTFAPPF